MIREFLEFYKFEYTLNVFLPETTLTLNKSVSREDLESKVNLNNSDRTMPVLMNLIKSSVNGVAGLFGGIKPSFTNDLKKDSFPTATSPV
jgi:hypothetical protein